MFITEQADALSSVNASQDFGNYQSDRQKQFEQYQSAANSIQSPAESMGDGSAKPFNTLDIRNSDVHMKPDLPQASGLPSDDYGRAAAMQTRAQGRRDKNGSRADKPPGKMEPKIRSGQHKVKQEFKNNSSAK